MTDKEEYLVYLIDEKYPIFIWADEYEVNEDFYRFLFNGNYNISIPKHIVDRVEHK